MEERSKKYTLVTFNIFLRPPLINNNGNDYKNERLSLFQRRIQNFDFVNFQEMFGSFSHRKKVLINEALAKGYPFINDPPERPLFSKYIIDSGLLTLSKYPILQVDFRPFDTAIGIDGVAYKGLLYSRIRLDSGIMLNLFNLHLQAVYSSIYTKASHSYFNVRLNQIMQLKTFIKDFLALHTDFDQDDDKNDFHEIVLIAGDFNVNINAPPMPATFQLSDSKFDAWIQARKETGFREYDFLVESLSFHGRDEVIDWVHTSNNGDSYITYADYTEDEQGNRVPLELKLTSKDDLCSGQCLDYIFQILPLKQQIMRLKANAQVEKFLVNDDEKEIGVGQLSDHYGLKIEFEI